MAREQMAVVHTQDAHCLSDVQASPFLVLPGTMPLHFFSSTLEADALVEAAGFTTISAGLFCAWSRSPDLPAPFVDEGIVASLGVLFGTTSALTGLGRIAALPAIGGSLERVGPPHAAKSTTPQPTKSVTMPMPREERVMESRVAEPSTVV